jgi:hypothetical protein
MNEREWLAANEPDEMLRLLGERAPERKLRLFACACLRELWGLTKSLPFRQAVWTAERFADGVVSRAEVREAFVRAWPDHWESFRSAAAAVANAPDGWSWLWSDVLRLAHAAAERAVRCALGARPTSTDGLRAWNGYLARARKAQAELAREVFGNPFRPAPAEAFWVTPDAQTLADGIAAERDFDALPVLADALEDAGCDDEALLRHCRGGGKHALGCWALDVAAGKAARVECALA